MAHDVFLSYSSKDGLTANAACNVLERNGVRIWMAPRDISPGMSWPGSIIHAINSTRVMILIVSSNANASPHVEREVERAIAKGVPVLPFRVEDVKLNDSLEYFISTPHWLDAFDPPLEQHLERLVTAVKRLLETDYVRKERLDPIEREPAREDEPRQVPEAVAAIKDAVTTARASPGTVAEAERRVASTEPLEAADARAQAVRTFKGHWFGIRRVAIGPDGKTALSGAENQKLILWDLASGQALRTFNGGLSEWLEFYAQTGPDNAVTCVAFAPDGRTALSSGRRDKKLKLWDIAGGRALRTFAGHSDFAACVAFAPDGKTALSGSADKTLKLWDLVSGQLLRTFTGHSDSVNSVMFSPDGKTALSGSYDKTLKLWDLANGDNVRAFIGRSRVLAFAPDGKTAIGPVRRGTLELWEIASGETLRTLTGHSDFVNSATFSPDGKTVLSGSADKTLRLWDLANGDNVRTFIGHDRAVTSVAISPDGKTAFSGSEDCTLKLWDLTRPAGSR